MTRGPLRLDLLQPSTTIGERQHPADLGHLQGNFDNLADFSSSPRYVDAHADGPMRRDGSAVDTTTLNEEAPSLP